MQKKQLKRFWSKVDKQGLDECWEWTASKNGVGYGQLRINHKIYYAHRVSWFLSYGKIPADLEVCHHCDNPSCVNPDHLFLGTHLDNHLDSASKGRKAKKLTIDEVQEIQEILAEGGWTQQEIGDAFGVARETISQIKRGKTWAWLVS